MEGCTPLRGVITFAIGARRAVLNQSREMREANLRAIPDPARRAALCSVLERGVDAPEFVGALGAFLDLIDEMEMSLEPEGWLSGDRFSLADVAALPYVLRLEHLSMAPLVSYERRPRVASWLSRVKARRVSISVSRLGRRGRSWSYFGEKARRLRRT